jgi:hypothetical protein
MNPTGDLTVEEGARTAVELATLAVALLTRYEAERRCYYTLQSPIFRTGETRENRTNGLHAPPK